MRGKGEEDKEKAKEGDGRKRKGEERSGGAGPPSKIPGSAPDMTDKYWLR